MTYIGAMRTRYQGPVSLGIKYASPARVAVERTIAMFDVRAGAQLAATRTITYPDGAWIRVRVFANAPPIVTIDTHGVVKKLAQKQEGRAPTGLAVQATSTGVGPDSGPDAVEPNYVLRYDGVESTWHDKLVFEGGAVPSLHIKQEYARVVASMWHQYGSSRAADGTIPLDTEGYPSHMGSRLAACFTHVVRHPETKEVVAINGGLQVVGKAVKRSGNPPPVNDNVEVKETTWMAFSSSNDPVYIHANMRERRPIGNPDSGEFVPFSYNWGAQK